MCKRVGMMLNSEAEFCVTCWREVDQWCLALGLLQTQMFGFTLQQFQEETETESRRGRNFPPAYQLTYLESSLSYFFLPSLSFLLYYPGTVQFHTFSSDGSL